MRSLTLKLVLAFTLVSLVGIGLVALMTARFTGDQFREIFNDQKRSALLAELVDFYAQNGSWRGIETLTDKPGFIQEYGWGFIILDRRGNVVLPNSILAQNSRYIERFVQIEDRIAIELDGNQVGALINLGIRNPSRPPLPNQISRLYNTLIFASIGAVLVSLSLAVLLARSLTHSLRELTTATQKVARGELDQQVPVRSQDELGQLAAAFNQMSADLKKSRDLRQQMTADIAHELRTPLTVVLGHTEALSEGQLPPAPETFDIIYDETKRLKRLVEDLRMLSLSDAGELHLNFQLVPPGELLERTAAARRQEARGSDIQLHVDAPEHLPAVHVDPDRMIQVLVNLLDNALRFTPAGGKVKLSARAGPRGVEIAVEDTGPGIPAEQLDHLFERFYHGDKARQRESGGSGLGLAIAKSMVEAQGGQIKAHSVPGQGAKLIITLPVPPEQLASS
jgi:signal transduction histidine kinase